MNGAPQNLQLLHPRRGGFDGRVDLAIAVEPLGFLGRRLALLGLVGALFALRPLVVRCTHLADGWLRDFVERLNQAKRENIAGAFAPKAFQNDEPYMHN